MNDQFVILILGILATLAGGIAKYIQASGDAKVQALKVELEKAEGANVKTASDEKQTDNLIASQNDLVVTLARMIERFDLFVKRFDEIKRTIEDVQQHVDDWHLSIKTLFEQEARRIIASGVQQRQTLEASRHQEFQEFADQFAKTFISMQLAQRLDPELFAVPTPGHPGWKYKYATPTRGVVKFYKAPWLDDNTPLRNVEIDAAGELVHVIESYVHGWHVVAKTKNGFDHPGMGYVPAWSVKLADVKGEH